MKNIIGNKYNKLTVLELERKEKRNNHWRYYYKCKCDCGKIKTLERDSIVFGGAKSCGCAFKGMNAKHNLSSTRIYKIYLGIKKRCYNKKCHNYKNYGARGIIMCDEWLNDFMKFYDWSLKNGYKNDLSIDRINVDGNYEPSNCRWANKETQCNNKTNNVYYEYKGEKLTGTQISKKYGVNYNTFRNRLKSGLTVKEAIEK